MCCYESQALPVVFSELWVTLASRIPLLLEIEYPVLLIAGFVLINQDEI